MTRKNNLTLGFKRIFEMTGKVRSFFITWRFYFKESSPLSIFLHIKQPFWLYNRAKWRHVKLFTHISVTYTNRQMLTNKSALINALTSMSIKKSHNQFMRNERTSVQNLLEKNVNLINVNEQITKNVFTICLRVSLFWIYEM